jgi:hypothetical protein
MTTATTTDGTPSVVRAPLIPARLVSALWAFGAITGIYATLAITQTAVGSPLPRLLHGTVVLVLAIAAIGWLIALAAAKLDEHAAARSAAAIAAVRVEVRTEVRAALAGPIRPAVVRSRRISRRAAIANAKAALTPVQEAELRGMLRGALDRDERGD